MERGFSLIVAVARKTGGIGKGGAMPWRSVPTDMQHFKAVTLGLGADKENPSAAAAAAAGAAGGGGGGGGGGTNAVVMGRVTWESIPPKFRPLPGRLNVVLSRSRDALGALPAGVLGCTSLDAALRALDAIANVRDVFVMGGAQVYAQALDHPACRRLVVTHVWDVEGEDECDAFFPNFSDLCANSGVEGGAGRWVCASQSEPQRDAKSGAFVQFFEYVPRRTGVASPSGNSNSNSNGVSGASGGGGGGGVGGGGNPEEQQYLDLVRDVIANGARRGDRTGTGTLSKFGVQMRFSLRNNALPLLTTKRVFWRGVAEELLWFVRGCTDNAQLQAKGVHIWDGNGSREFLDKLGHVDREEGDLGPVYGFQWRHFGAQYKDCHTDYSGQGVDQLKQCIHTIKTNPDDRRIILTAWNPLDLAKMALPPCHLLCQFYVANGELSCQMYQRSADLGLGVPFNIASYALLTHMVAQVCGLRAGDLVHTIGDAHVYANHVEALKEQLERSPRPFPTIRINPERHDIDGFVFDDFEVCGYDPHKAIKMKMAV